MKRVPIVALYILSFCLLLLSCKPQVPNEFLQPDEMENILYDYHISLGMIEVRDTNDFSKRLCMLSVLKKYGVTEAELDSSLVYYTRHSDRFQTIYENLSKHLNDEALSLGASATDAIHYGESTSSGDTMNIWKESPSFVLTTNVPYNVKSFYLRADSSYHRGDKVILNFNVQSVFQDGYKDGVVMLAVKYSNDSVVSQTIHVSESRRYDLVINNNKDDIKDIRGFFCLQKSTSASISTLKLFFITDIHLVKYHVSDFNISEKRSDTILDSAVCPK